MTPFHRLPIVNMKRPVHWWHIIHTNVSRSYNSNAVIQLGILIYVIYQLHFGMSMNNLICCEQAVLWYFHSNDDNVTYIWWITFLIIHFFFKYKNSMTIIFQHQFFWDVDLDLHCFCLCCERVWRLLRYHLCSYIFFVLHFCTVVVHINKLFNYCKNFTCELLSFIYEDHVSVISFSVPMYICI